MIDRRSGEMTGAKSGTTPVVNRWPMVSVATSTRYRSGLPACCSARQLNTIVSSGSGAEVGSPELGGVGVPGGVDVPSADDPLPADDPSPRPDGRTSQTVTPAATRAATTPATSQR